MSLSLEPFFTCFIITIFPPVRLQSSPKSDVTDHADLIVKTAEELYGNNLNVLLVYFNHCTGQKAST